MAIEVKREEIGLLPSEAIWRSAFKEAGIFLDQVEDSQKLFDHPAARNLCQHFLALQVLEPLTQHVGSFGPLTSFQVTELGWNISIGDEIENAKRLARERLNDCFGQICDRLRLDPQSNKARQLYESSQEAAQTFVREAFRRSRSPN